jgi:hypothetical protein
MGQKVAQLHDRYMMKMKKYEEDSRVVKCDGEFIAVVCIYCV